MGAQLSTPDLLLARRAAAGQPAAWDELVALHGRRLFNLAFQFAGDVAEAEDLTQEIFLRLHENLRSYRGDVPFLAWALRLSRNLCIDHYRHARRLRRHGVTVPAELLRHQAGSDDPRADAWRRQQLSLVYEVLGEMAEEMATVIVLRDLQELTYEEITAALEIPLGTVKSRLNRARQELAEKVRQRLDAPNLPSTREQAL